MWHEARKQEKKLREAMVDYRKRAERRRIHYDKMRGDPNQLLRIHGNKCKLHLDLSKGGVDTTMSVSLMEHSDQKTEWLRCSDICMKFNSLLTVFVPVTVTAYSCFDIWRAVIHLNQESLHYVTLFDSVSSIQDTMAG